MTQVSSMSSQLTGSAVEVGQAQLAGLVETLPVGVFILNARGDAVYANSKAQELLGRDIHDGDRADNIGQRFATYVSGSDDEYPQNRMPIVRALQGERATIDDMEIDRDGHRIALEVTATPILNESSEVVFAVAIFQDITERRRAQSELARLNEALEHEVQRRTATLAGAVAALEREVQTRELYERELLSAKAVAEHANRSKTMFLMHISHELRTPLTHIIGFTDLLMDRIQDPHLRRLAESAAEGGRALEEKLTSLIDLARTETEGTGQKVSRFDCDALLLRASIGSRVRCHAPTLIGELVADEEALLDILSTIFHGVSLKNEEETVASARSEDAEGTPRLVIRVADDRLATRVRALSGLFGEGGRNAEERRFQQQEIDFKLAVARARARVFGGDVTCISEQGRETVRVTIPIAR
ncbi:MAG TPA: PAS domain-containing protein [Thermoanaerobaculia bacterium]|nr:PAS domain-containing protein [Thermoanaerobaculia bacterium]